MLERTILAVLNHLLTAEGWALARLKPFAGAHARFDVGPLSWSFAVEHDGSLRPCEAGHEPQVTIRLPDDTPVRLLVDRSSIFQAARIAGAADFAEALGFVAKNLRWDAEADLARLIGDVPARRIHLEAHAAIECKRDMVTRLAANLTEFVVDEEGLVVRPPSISGFCSDVDRLRDDLARLEKRVSRL